MQPRSLIPVVVLLSSACTLHAQSEFRWSGFSITDDWNDASNWINITQGGVVSGFPSLSDTAVFSTSASTFGGQAFELRIDSLSTVTLGGPGINSTEVADNIANMGTLTFAPDSVNNNSGVVDQSIFVDSGNDIMIGGSGLILMNGTETGLQGAGQLVSTARNASGHTIAGTGRFDDIRIVNDGIIQPSFGTLELRSAEVQGSGSIQIAANGTLALGQDSLIRNTGIVGVSGSRITTGVGQGTLQDVELDGLLTYGMASISATTIAGTITNNGTLSFILDSSNQSSSIDQHLFIEMGTSATLSGDGQVVFNGSETGIQGFSTMSATLINDTDHTITGAGAFRDIQVNNSGVIRPSFGSITAVNATIRGTGLIDIADNGTLFLDSAALIENTTIRGVAGSTLSAAFSNGTLRNLVLSGNLIYGSSNLSSISLSGTINNTGILSFANDVTDNSSSVIDLRFFVDPGPVGPTIAGGGQIVLNGSETGFQGAGFQVSTMTNGPEHTIGGAGTFQEISVDNHGVVQPSFGDMVLIDAELRGAGTIDIASNGGLVINTGAAVRNTTVHGTQGSVIDANSGSGTMRDLTLTGALIYGRSGTSSTTIAGVITNSSELAFAQDSINNSSSTVDQRFFVESGPSGASIEGSGRITLNGNETGFQGAGSSFSSLTNGPDHTVTGNGTIRNLRLVNLGIVSPSSGEMLLTGAEIRGDGVVQIAGDGVLLLNDGSIANNTTINGVSGSIIGSLSGQGEMRDLTLTGNLIYGLGARSTIMIAGEITNNSQLTFTLDTTNQDSGAIDQRFFVASGPAGASISGSGRLVLNGSETGIQGAGATFSTMANGATHTLAGSGTVEDIRIINRGTISPSGGDRSILFRDSTLEMAAEGSIGIELAGLAPGQFSRILFSSLGAADLAGTLRIELESGYVPSLGNAWVILDGGTIAGQFSQIETPASPAGEAYRVIYEPDQVRVVLTCEADFTGDGLLNFFDVTEFLSLFQSQDPQADLNGDGNFNFFDVSAFLAVFAQSCS